MNLIDSHCHLTDIKFSSINIQELLNNANKHNVNKIINFGVDYKDSLNVKEISQNHECLYYGFGCHPHEAKSFLKAEFEESLLAFKNNPKCVAIGEIGLDYFYSYSEQKSQKDVFIYFLEKAQEFQLPASIHSRGAEEDVYQIIKDTKKIKMILHSYTGPLDTLKKLLDIGIYISLNGMITFKNNKNLLDIIQQIPLDKLLIETDGPYLTPEPYRKHINQPEYLVVILNKLAEIKRISIKELANIIEKNTNGLFFP
ncbi:MAG: TatD family hydrolase [Candidatus Margulisbacteria bacterium]|nr:TatD family hydrolase [Candidatus Margulisiibacteriota bacterium]